MAKKLTDLRVLFIVLLAGLMFETEAKAYADPGSGILLWQVLVSVFVGALFYARRILDWGRQRWSRKS